MHRERPVLITPSGDEIRQYPEGARCEITRSFSYDMNFSTYRDTNGMPLRDYEAEHFFMSQKTECGDDDAEAVSNAVYQFCKSQVLKAVREREEELGIHRLTRKARSR